MELPPSTPPTEQPSLGSRIASDIGTGITELPRAALKGARDAANETIGFAVDAGNWVGQQPDKLVGFFGGAPGKDVTAPQLPSVDAPESTTGKLAASVSQFIVGMVGLGKIAKPLEAAGGLATAGKAAKVATETAKAATVGAVAFDPSGERLSNIIESIPAISNPVSQFLQAQPGDSRALGRVKNALESIGMDAVLVGGLTAGVKAYRAIAEWKAGRGSIEEVQKAIAEAQRAEAAGSKIEEPTPNAAAQAEAPTGPPSQVEPSANTTGDAAGGPGAGPRVAEGVEAPGAPAQEVAEPYFSYSPAVKIDGKVYQGGNHSDAIERAAMANKTTVDDLLAHHGGEEKVFDEIDGFVRSDGEFVNRTEAYRQLEAQDAAKKAKAEEPEVLSVRPSFNMGDVDLRDITMVNGKNAYDQYQEWAARPSKNGRSIKETVARIMQTEAYKRAPDGSVGTRGTRQWMVAGVMHKYREMGARRMRTDANVRAALAEKHREVQRAFAAKSAPQTPEQQGKGTISNIGRAFGIDLDGLMK